VNLIAPGVHLDAGNLIAFALQRPFFCVHHSQPEKLLMTNWPSKLAFHLHLTLALLLPGAPRLIAATAVEPLPVSGNIPWVFNYEEGKKLALQTGKPMLVVFRCER
jgi:hypothetical protein